MFTTTQSWNCMRIFKTQPPTAHPCFFTPLRLFNLQLVFFKLLALIQLRCFVRHSQIEVLRAVSHNFPGILSVTKANMANILPMMQQPTHCLGISNASAVEVFETLGFGRFAGDFPAHHFGTASEGLSCLNPRSNYFNN